MKKWNILQETIDSSQLTVTKIVETLLENRGLKKKADLEAFLHPKLEDVTLESVGIDEKQVKKTLKRLEKAIASKEQLIVYGDYDVDGITGSAILWETLHAAGANVLPYIPHRIEEGYGLSIAGIKNILEGNSGLSTKADLTKTKLIITVDNGIVANEAVAFAKEKGVDVIITDHHVPPTGGSDVLPKAFAIVHTTKLCGAGVAWLLAKEIKYELRNMKYEFEKDDLLELAALGTVADLVPLQGANRTIVKFGLEKLSKTRRLGLLELFREAGCDKGELGVYEIGHVIAPRLNATGRMASAMDSLRLLCTKDHNRAEELAGLLGTTNKERQNVMLEATKHAIQTINSLQVTGNGEQAKTKKLLIAVHEDYPEGVIGLVAGRIVEEFYRPAIVISKGEKHSKGSVRSIQGFNIIEFLRQSADLFVNLGGHPMAAGFTIETEKIIFMQESFEKLAETMDEGLLVRTIKIDCELPLTTVNDSLHMAIQQLAPFGMANSEPTFVSRGVKVDDLRVLGRDGKHLRLTVSQPNAIMEAIAFGMGDLAKDLKIGDNIDIVYTIDENNWNGRRKLQLKVKDINTLSKKSD